MIPQDTSADAYLVQARFVRRLTPGERLERALLLCDEMREMCWNGIQRRHPEFGVGQVSEAFERIVMGAERDVP